MINLINFAKQQEWFEIDVQMFCQTMEENKWYSVILLVT